MNALPVLTRFGSGSAVHEVARVRSVGGVVVPVTRCGVVVPLGAKARGTWATCQRCKASAAREAAKGGAS